MRHENTLPAALIGIPLAIGLAASGLFVGRAVHEVRSAQRQVTVKGLSQREVPADLAVWPVTFNVTGNDLALMQEKLEGSARKVGAFLEARGFDRAEFTVSSPRVTDFEVQGFRGAERPPVRYAAETTVTLRSGKVDAVKAAIQESGALIKDGVALVRSYEQATTYFFTGLDRIKPEMIAEATKDARRAAEQFAVDSGSRVGAIRSAQQGYFEITDRDPFSPEFKRIRVVTTVQYFLED